MNLFPTADDPFCLPRNRMSQLQQYVVRHQEAGDIIYPLIGGILGILLIAETRQHGMLVVFFFRVCTVWLLTISILRIAYEIYC